MIDITDPVIHLRFDESLDDSSENEIVTTLAGTEQYEDGPFENTKAITLNGSTSIAFPNSSAFYVGTGDFTFAFWFKSSVVNNDKFFLGGRSAWGTLHITTGGYNSTAGIIRYNGSSTILGSTVLSDGKWHHIAFVRYGGALLIFLDGLIEKTGTDTTNYSGTSGTWYVSRNSYGENQITGAMAEFIFVPYAVYTEEFDIPDKPYNLPIYNEAIEESIDATGEAQCLLDMQTDISESINQEDFTDTLALFLNEFSEFLEINSFIDNKNLFHNIVFDTISMVLELNLYSPSGILLLFTNHFNLVKTVEKLTVTEISNGGVTITEV